MDIAMEENVNKLNRRITALKGKSDDASCFCLLVGSFVCLFVCLSEKCRKTGFHLDQRSQFCNLHIITIHADVQNLPR